MRSVGLAKNWSVSRTLYLGWQSWTNYLLEYIWPHLGTGWLFCPHLEALHKGINLPSSKKDQDSGSRPTLHSQEKAKARKGRHGMLQHAFCTQLECWYLPFFWLWFWRLVVMNSNETCKWINLEKGVWPGLPIRQSKCEMHLALNFISCTLYLKSKMQELPFTVLRPYYTLSVSQLILDFIQVL